MIARLLLLWVWLGLFRLTERAGLTMAQIRKLPAAIDVSTAAQAYGISRASAYAAIADGTFPAQVIRVNRRMKVITASIIASLEGSGDHAGVA